MVPNRYVRSQYSLVPYSCNDSKNSQRIPSLLQNKPNYVIFAVFYRFLISFFLLAFRRHLLSIWFGYRTGLKLSHFQPQAAGTAAFGTCCVMLICTSSSSDLHVTYTGRRKKNMAISGKGTKPEQRPRQGLFQPWMKLRSVSMKWTLGTPRPPYHVSFMGSYKPIPKFPPKK